MRVLIITTTLYEKNSPFNHLFKDIIEGLLLDNHEIIRIVAVDDLNSDEFKMGIQSDKIEYIVVKRKRRKKSNIILRYISDIFTALKMKKIIKKVNADILFEDCLYSSYWIIKEASKRNMQIITMIQDLWPDNAVQTSLINYNSLLYKFFDFWQKKAYKLSDLIVTISPDMSKFIINEKNVDKNKVYHIYNWGYSDKAINIPIEDNRFKDKFNLSDEYFYVVYAGNIGRMQNINLIIDAAEFLKNDSTIKFLIVGDGVYKTAIAEELVKRNINNVIMLPFQPSDMAVDIYSFANVNIIPLVKGGIKTALPSKTPIVLSCGTPVIFCFDKNSCFELENKCYRNIRFCSPDNHVELAECIKELKKLKMEKDYEAFYRNFIRKDNINKYINLINKQKR